MKKFILLALTALMIPVCVCSQQDTISKVKSKSITFSIAPALLGVPDDFLPEMFWPASLYVTKNIELKKHISLSIGGHILYNKIGEEGFFYPEYGGHHAVKFTWKYGLLDVPVRFNFHINRINDKFNLYVKSEINNAFILSSTIAAPDYANKFWTENALGFNMFFGLGFGADLKVAKRLSIVFEPGARYTVFGSFPELMLADCQIGIKMNLKK